MKLESINLFIVNSVRWILFLTGVFFTAFIILYVALVKSSMLAFFFCKYHISNYGGTFPVKYESVTLDNEVRSVGYELYILKNVKKWRGGKQPEWMACKRIRGSSDGRPGAAFVPENIGVGAETEVFVYHPDEAVTFIYIRPIAGSDDTVIIVSEGPDQGGAFPEYNSFNDVCTDR